MFKPKGFKMKCSKTLAATILFLTVNNGSKLANEAGDNSYYEEVKKHIENILSSREFSDVDVETSILTILARGIRSFIDSIKIWFRRLNFPDFGGEIFKNGISENTLLFIGICGLSIIIILLCLIFYFLRKNFRSVAEIRQRQDAEILISLKDPEMVEQKVLEHAKNGDFRQALRYLYIALLLRLNEYDIIRIDRGKTNRQYLNEARNSQYHYYDLFFKFTQDFNRCWYGNAQVKYDDFKYWQEKYHILTKEPD